MQSYIDKGLLFCISTIISKGAEVLLGVVAEYLVHAPSATGLLLRIVFTRVTPL
jgi:hypothetical protein